MLSGDKLKFLRYTMGKTQKEVAEWCNVSIRYIGMVEKGEESLSEENYKALRDDNRIWFGAKGNNVPRIKTFLSEVQQGTVCKTIWYRTEVGD